MKLLVLDGNSILNRAFYGIKILTTKGGFYTNAIYGFMNTFEKLKDEIKPQAIAIAFDLKAPTFRHKLYKEYKAKRKGMPEELASQLPILKELLVYMGYKIVEVEGYEADDILGSLSDICVKANYECIIATGDRDSLQLVNNKTKVILTSTKFGKPESVYFDKEKIKEVYGLLPSQLIDVKALQGDASDNIPGVKGIGEKGALELIKKHESIKNIYENLENLDIKENLRKKLIDDKENAFLSYELGTIAKDVPIDNNIENYIQKPINKNKTLELMTKLEFFSLINKIKLLEENNTPQIKPAIDVKLNFIKNIEELNNFINKQKELYILLEYNKKGDIKTIALNIDNNIFLIDDKDDINEYIKVIFESSKDIKTYDCKKIYSLLNKLNINTEKIIFDLFLASYILNPNSSGYNIKKISQEYGIANEGIKVDEEYKNIATEIYLLPKICEVIEKKIEDNNQKDLLQNIEMPLAKVLADMERVGFCINKQGLKNYGELLNEKIKKLEKEIHIISEHEFNIKSPQQLGVVLFEDMGIPHGKKTKTGYSTSAEVLENIRNDYPIVDKILEYRMLTKLKSTYCDSILKLISEDGRIRSQFIQTETRTGRISSIEPNMQNIPVRTNEGKELRKFFCSKEGNVLVDADYSQIELRVLAHIANDKNMIDAFINNDDIHTITASQVFNMPMNMVTSLMRRRAKEVNFGIVYGIGAFSLAKNMGISRFEAARYIEEYFKHYMGVEKYMHDIIEIAKKNGYVTTMFGRRRYLPELVSSNHNIRAFGERVALNMPIQGTAADIIKMAMINVNKRLQKELINAKIILQVHDELIVETKKENAEMVSKILKEEMENVVKLKVPLLASPTIGKTWYDTKN